MSRLDQAFIKAYIKRSAAPPTSPGPEHRRIDAAHAALRPHLPAANKKTAVAAKPAPHIVLTATSSTPEPAEPAPPRAAFEVDRFLWPEACQRILSAARSACEKLVDELLPAVHSGKKHWLLASSERGAGCTSFALALARLLSERGLKVALVEADYIKPDLARQLKLLPATGWDEVVGGKVPATEAWIESVADSLVLVPLRDTVNATALADRAALPEAFAPLRQVHDVLLIDAGSLQDAARCEMLKPLIEAVPPDGALVVHRAHGVAMLLHEAQRHLQALGVTCRGVVENFA
jgi:Mrp family chromosome partitioning ATPase